MTANLATMIDANVPGNKPAIIFDQGAGDAVVFSYDQLRGRIASCAQFLKTKRVCPGDHVALLSGNHLDYMTAFYAIMYCGAVACPINFKLPRPMQQEVLTLCRAQCVFVDAAHANRSSVPEFALDDEAIFSEAGAGLPPHQVHGDDVACIMFTSGSTGLPKAVPITHGGYGWALRHYEFARASSVDLRTLIAAPFFHMNAQATTMLSLFFGGTCIMMPTFSTETFLDTVAQHQVSEITGVPTMMALAIRAIDEGYRADLSSVSVVALGSAPLSESLLCDIQRVFPNASIDNGYGTTEGGLVSFGPAPEGLTKPPLSIGYPTKDVDFYLEGGGDEGVLWIKTPMTSSGYLGLPQVNAEKFKDGYYNTGDVLRRDETGFYFFVGRADDMFVCGGENIFPAEVEKVLRSHPVIAEAVVVPQQDAIKGARPVAFVTLQAAGDVDVDDIKAYALEHLPAYAHPRTVTVLETLPRGTTEKIDRKALNQRANQERSR
ncbi:MAG: class I adenylate-forming enzyme family protein [Pseudomonadota bacterium]